MQAHGLMHLRGKPSTAFDRRKAADVLVLPLIERVGPRSYEAEMLAVCDSPDAEAWVQEHKAELRKGVSLHMELEGIHARGNVLRGYLRKPPRIAPPRWPERQGEASPSDQPPAVPA